MKVCIFSTTYFPQMGGAERFIHALATHLANRDVQVSVLVPLSRNLGNFRPDYKLLKIKGGRFLKASSNFSEALLFFNLLYYQIIYRFDIIQAVVLYPPGYVSLRLKRFFKKTRVFCRPTGSDIQTLPEIEYGLRLNRALDKKIRRSLNQFDGLIANSQSLKEELIKAGSQEAKIKIIPNGLDLERFKKKPVDIRKIYSLPEGAKIILSVGRSHPKKNYETLIKAVGLVVKDCRSCYCVIVGGERGKLEKMIRDLNLEDRIILTGELVNEKLIDIYLTSNLFVFPSFIEGQPNVLLEALAAGLPVVAANVPGSRDIVEEGKTGFLVEAKDAAAFADKILGVLSSPVLNKRFSRQAKKEAEKYSWEKIVSRYIELYQ